MSNHTDFDALTRSTVYDRAGDKVGKVEQLYISDANDLPTWVSVKTGLFGTSHSLVPLAGAKHTGDRLEVPYTKDQIKDAPHLDSEHGTTAEQDQALLRHYGLTDTTSGWDTYGKHAGRPTDTAPTDTAPTDTARAGGAKAAAASGDVPAGKDTRGGALDRDAASVVRSEERLNVGKDTVASGRARLRKYVVTEQQSVNVPVTREEVRVVREPIDAAHHSGKASIGEDAAEVVLHEERVTVSKETVPVERVGLAVDQVTKDHTVTEDLRKERIDTDGIHADGLDHDRRGATDPRKTPKHS